MSDRLYVALENCLRAMERGVDLESCLKRFPDLADELRPLLEAALVARELAPKAPSSAMQRRRRAQLLQQAAEMRSAQQTARGRSFRGLRMVGVSLVLVAVFFLSGTGLVRASSGALPGDNLYPVKRTWEDVRLWFVFNPESREKLESLYERERIDEIDELIAEGRSAYVSFSGIVTAQDQDRWLVSGVSIAITPQTKLPAEQVNLGDSVMITGHTNPAGYLQADSVQVLPPGSVLPSNEPEDRPDSSGEGDDDARTPTVIAPAQPTEPESNGEKPGGEDGSNGSDDKGSNLLTSVIDGSVQSKDGSKWVINGKQVDVSKLANAASIPLGAKVKVEGYFTANGQFVATTIEVEDSPESLSGSDGSNSSGDDHSGSSGETGDDNGGDGSSTPEPDD